MKIKLMEDAFSEDELKSVVDTFKSGKYTQGEIVKQFEKKFAEWNGSKYAVMVNSGSSANLLMVSMLKEKYRLKDGDEVLVPSVTWPTTVYPLVQYNFFPVFCDVDKSFNLDVNSMKRMISNKTKAVFLVHLLGQPANLEEIRKICDENNLLLLEDCCESTGAKFNKVKIGNFGVMGSFSFYFGHHITTVEGGMIVTNDFELYDLLRSARSHGWIRDSARINNYPSYEDKHYVFDMLGYNLRSTNINAAIGLVQLKKIDEFIKIRLKNHKYFLEKIKDTGLGYQRVNLDETSSFCFALIFKDRKERNFVLKELLSKGIESRPIVAGNLARQPVFKKMHVKMDKTPMADLIDDCGIYIPNNQFITSEKIDYMLESINELLDKIRRNG
jgi:CDP-6-deoxy-D-xylo-4-hexulose-3-dehydrase